MIKIEFPADRKDIALAIGKALTEIGQETGNAPIVSETSAASASETQTAAAAGAESETTSQTSSDAAGTGGETDTEAACEYSQALYAAGVPPQAGVVHAFKRALGVIEQRAMEKDAEIPTLQAASAAVSGITGELNGESMVDAIMQLPALKKAFAPATVEHVADAALGAPQVDEKGVPFNAELCGKAAIPFYGSGKKKGQWKKRQGVDEDAYDEWYAEALLGARIEEDPEDQATETTSDSSVAANFFGEQQTAAAGEDVPQDAGQLMKWVSEQQAAGNITQQQVTDAYTALQLPFDAVMNPAYPVADNCAAIYNHLKGQIG